MSILRTLGKKFAGNNIFMKHILRLEYQKGNYLKGIIFALYTYPIFKLFGLGDSFRGIPEKYYKEIHELLHLAKIDGVELIRVGKKNDGGYIMPDDFGSDDKIAYSFGISDDVSWDKDMASRGYEVFMYDHTIDGLPEENPRFHWSKLGIANGHTQDDRLKTLDELMKVNHHENKRNMILKMDVEGAEWGFLEQVSHETLSQFSQIVLEIHGINDPKFQGIIPAALRKLNMTHQAVHIHGQNIGHYISLGAQTFCNQLEVSYVRRDRYSLDNNYDVNLPLAVDMPGAAEVPEISLGRWNRKINPDDKFSSITVIV